MKILCLIVGIIAVMLLLVKCYDKEGVVTLQLGHPSFDLASGGYLTKKKKKKCGNKSANGLFVFKQS